jgi:hypothetical protein
VVAGLTLSVRPLTTTMTTGNSTTTTLTLHPLDSSSTLCEEAHAHRPFTAACIRPDRVIVLQRFANYSHFLAFVRSVVTRKCRLTRPRDDVTYADGCAPSVTLYYTTYADAVACYVHSILPDPNPVGHALVYGRDCEVCCTTPPQTVSTKTNLLSSSCIVHPIECTPIGAVWLMDGVRAGEGTCSTPLTVEDVTHLLIGQYRVHLVV